MSKRNKSITVSVPRRNTLAVVARARRAETMHDRRAPRGGARNDQADLISAYEEEYDDWDW